MKNDLTIIVNSCKSYSDVLEVFFMAWRKYNNNIQNRLIVCTEEINEKNQIQTNKFSRKRPKDDWGDRILKAVNAAETDFVLITYDDFVLDEYISEEGIAKALELLEMDPKASVVYLIDAKLIIKQGDKVADQLFVEIEDKAPYKLNSSPGIWRKSDFISFTKVGDTPWAWEAFGTYRTQDRDKRFFSVAPGRPPIYSYDNSQGGAIYRGKWVKSFVVKFNKNFDNNVDWDERGYADSPNSTRRTLYWKLNFLIIGFRMVGFRSFKFIASEIIRKIYG